MTRISRSVAALLLALSSVLPAAARDVVPVASTARLAIPRLAAAPRLEDFLNMRPDSPAASAMAHVGDLRQLQPGDGVPATQRSEVYLGYDDKNLYAVWVCFDNDPSALRARLTRRENIWDDDAVDIWLDTFNDHRRAYEFMVNPLGVQADGIASDGHEDFSFDTVWYSKGKRTPEGYVVWMAIPFASLRFQNQNVQQWGILLERRIARNNEQDFWPPVTRRISGTLTQEAPATGLEGISPGRNMQFIPYGLFRSFRSLDTRGAVPGWTRSTFKPDGGLDSKFILKDSFVLDTTIEPDFSQVETDDPQVTVNQRFAVFFPEKRPFFLENASYFQTPIDLFFTRNIADPQFGARLTGKTGPYSVGMLLADDRAPGLEVAPSDPLAGKRAHFAIGRLSRDLFGNGSNIGVMYTDREFAGSFNRVGGIDGHIRLNQTWSTTFQAVASSTYDAPTRTYWAGPAMTFEIGRSGRRFSYNTEYNDFSDGYQTYAGFYRQTDIHDLSNSVRYTHYLKPNRWLISIGPNFRDYHIVDHEGDSIGWGYMPELRAEFTHATHGAIGYAEESETLRPRDYSALPQNRQYTRYTKYVQVHSQALRQVGLRVDYRWGRKVVYDAPAGLPPFLGRRTSLEVAASMRPFDRLQIENDYLLLRFGDIASKHAVFNDHILQTKWNYQFTRPLSVRAIVQYNAVLSNPAYTSLLNSKGVGVNFLITYLLHPGTAVYAGYTSSLNNLARPLGYDADGNLLRTRKGFLNDGREIFVKISYLLRF